MIRHMVLMKRRAGVEQASISEIERCLAGLPEQIDGITAFEFGRNNSPEGLDHGFGLGFTMDFADVAARDAYLPHHAHQTCAAMIKEASSDVLVFDFEI